MIKDKFYRLYRQYKVEKRFRTIIFISYKLKLIIYFKVLIFAFFYCFTFFVFHIFLLTSKINYYADGFFYYYLIIIAIEIFFTIVLGIIFYPSKISIMYYLPIVYDYDSLNFIAEIKQEKENDMNISKLNKKKLFNEYKEKEYPIALISPFAKTNKPFNEFHFGIVPK